MFQQLKVIDSHTGGEPTRVIIEGCPNLGNGSMSERRQTLREKHDWVRKTTVLEPRAFEAMVGAALQEPSNPDCAAGVIFFNNVGYLNMCVHGMIGLAITLKRIGKIDIGSHKIETPVGVVTIQLGEESEVSIENVPSYRLRTNVEVETPDYGKIVGDIAWGGNWFFLIDEQGPKVEYAKIEELVAFTKSVRRALDNAGIKGDDDQQIDHIEVFGPPSSTDADSTNFVLCPGNEYDRSPCGTGLSARLACLADSALLLPNQTYRQASILNTQMKGSYQPAEGNAIIPTITSSAWITGESTLLIDHADPFKHGIDKQSVANLSKPSPNQEFKKAL